MNINFQLLNKKNHTVFIKFLKSMLLILIIPFLFLFIMYSSINYKIKEQTYERNLGMLENSVQKIELLFDNLDQITYYLKNNIDVINYYNVDLSSIGRSTSYMIKAQKVLATVKVGNNDIVNIQMYSDYSDTLIDYYTNGLFMDRYYGSSFSLEGVSIEQFRKEYLEQKDRHSCRYDVMTADRRTNNVLVYNNSFTGMNIRGNNSRIIYYISIDRLLKLFNPAEYTKDGFICMMDENGQMILKDNPSSYSIEQINYDSFQADSGYINLDMNGKKMFVTYYRSNNRNWLCLQAIPASKVLNVTSGFRTVMLCLLLLAVIVGAMLVLLVARKLSKPITEVCDILGQQEKKVPLEDFVYEIKRLMEHNADLMDKMQQQVSMMRTEAFYKLLTGESGKEEAIRDDLDKIGIRQNAAYYTILLLTTNDMNLDLNLEDISAQKVFIDNVIRQQAYPEIQDIYQIDFERMIILMASEEASVKQVRERAERLIQNVMEVIDKKVIFSISVGGDIVDDALKLPKAFMNAQRALNVPQNVFGNNKIQWYARAKQFMEIEAKDLHSLDDEYISLQNLVLVEKIKEYIKSNYSDQQLSLTSVGEEFCITEAYLSKLFKKATGENFSKYIEGIRMKYAKELIDQNKRVTEVAEMVGYNSPQVFRRAWKRYYGGTPSDNFR
jgi:AraC-like DNA-binding protein